MHKLSIFFLICLGLTNQVWAEEFFSNKKLIISDVDDTIKYSNILGSKREIIYNALFRKTAFAGMSELYNEFAALSESFVYYISGSPKDLHDRVESFLQFNRFPGPENLILRQSLFDDIELFKLDAISGLIDRINPEEVILIGDDTEKDPEIFHKIKTRYPNQVKSIYIHLVQNRKLPDINEMHGFFSAVEIVGDQIINKGILQNEKGLIHVAQGFNDQTYKSALYIDGRYCPAKGREILNTLLDLVEDLQAKEAVLNSQSHIIKTCQRYTNRS